jgi:hypothetical protein
MERPEVRKAAEKPKITVEQKLSMLSSRWKAR